MQLAQVGSKTDKTDWLIFATYHLNVNFTSHALPETSQAFSNSSNGITCTKLCHGRSLRENSQKDTCFSSVLYLITELSKMLKA